MVHFLLYNFSYTLLLHWYSGFKSFIVQNGWNENVLDVYQREIKGAVSPIFSVTLNNQKTYQLYRRERQNNNSALLTTTLDYEINVMVYFKPGE